MLNEKKKLSNSFLTAVNENTQNYDSFYILEIKGVKVFSFLTFKI